MNYNRWYRYWIWPPSKWNSKWTYLKLKLWVRPVLTTTFWLFSGTLSTFVSLVKHLHSFFDFVFPFILGLLLSFSLFSKRDGVFQWRLQFRNFGRSYIPRVGRLANDLKHLDYLILLLEALWFTAICHIWCIWRMTTLGISRWCLYFYQILSHFYSRYGI